MLGPNGKKKHAGNQRGAMCWYVNHMGWAQLSQTLKRNQHMPP